MSVGPVIESVDMSSDKYKSYSELAEREVEGSDYRIQVVDRQASIAVMAPHAGQIERLTSELAVAIAGDDHSLYLFEGLNEGLAQGKRRQDLHITSWRFDEPEGDTLAKSAKMVVGVHGCSDKHDNATVLLGGCATAARDLVSETLKAAGFKTATDGHRFPGKDRNNICNRSTNGAGIQIEVPWTLRQTLKKNQTQFNAFVAAIRSALSGQEDLWRLPQGSSAPAFNARIDP